MSKHGNKSQISATIDPQVLNRFDNEFDGDRSQFIEKQMRKYVEMNTVDNQELVERKEEIKEEMEKLDSKEDEIENKKSNLRGELTQIETKIEHQKEEQQKIEQAIDPLKEKYHEIRRKVSSKDEALDTLGTTERFWSWVEQLDDYDNEDLKKEVRKRIEN
jgi:chromosome segregation ATPase